MNRRSFLKTFLFGGSAIVFYSYLEPYNILVEEVSLDLGLDIKILFLTDIHMHGLEPLDDKIVKLTSKYVGKVDVVIFGGDQYDEYTPDIGVLKKILDIVSGKALYVRGNHEYWSRKKFDFKEAKELYDKYSIETINNRAVWWDNAKIGGVDWIFDSGETAKQYFKEVGKVDILVSHTPDTFKYIDNGYKVMLSGHTHGGQILGGLLYTNSRFGYTQGLYREGNRLLYVSRGAGEMFPLRLLTPREITIINL